MSEISCPTLPGHVLDPSSMIQYVSHVLATGHCRGIHVVSSDKAFKEPAQDHAPPGRINGSYAGSLPQRNGI